jgi:hypothetical protein
MRRLRTALRLDPKTLKYCDGDPRLSSIAECVRNRTSSMRFDPPGAGRVA